MFEIGVVTDEQRRLHFLGQRPDQLEQRPLGRHVDARLELDRRVKVELLLHPVDRLPDTRRGAGEHEVEAHVPTLHLGADPPRRLPSALVQRAVEIVEMGVIPARLGMPKNAEPFHFAYSTACGACAESRCSTRSIATSSGTRLIGTPGGNAFKSRDGIAAERMTKTPQSPCRRISRPNAWASRARTTRSS